jgi:hypothetical protein
VTYQEYRRRFLAPSAKNERRKEVRREQQIEKKIKGGYHGVMQSSDS